MKYPKRLFALQLLFLLIIPISLAEITLTLPEKDVYNLGEKISPSVSIKEDADYDGLFKMYISCGSYSLQYYRTLLNVISGSRTQVIVQEVQEPTLSKAMIGECTLKSDFESIDESTIDSGQSKAFSVTDEVRILIDDKFEAKPGEKIG